MRWLIVEDALRDRKGHWFEYLSTFARELPALGDPVTILADRSAEPFLIEQLHVRPVLPPSIWHRMSDGAGAVRRYARVPIHAWKTYSAGKSFLQTGKTFDVIFVPTVLVHHLLGWVGLIKGPLKPTNTRVLLFFPNTPVQLDSATNEPSWQRAPTARLFHRLIRSLRSEVAAGRVVLGAETHPMREALTRLTGVPFTYLPHPVSLPPAVPSSMPSVAKGACVTMASYGGARDEKGCDMLVAAVEDYCRRFQDSPVQFALQSVGGNPVLWQRLAGNPKVRLVTNYFKNGEYSRALAQTDVLLLPYRRSSYGLRVSRVVIEAMVLGLPVIVTAGTTLAEQAGEFGAAVLCEDGKPDSLVEGIDNARHHLARLKTTAGERRGRCQEHFSVREFRSRVSGEIVDGR
jgi:glycosyltransferase involved in cell wall biosynthesis